VVVDEAAPRGEWKEVAQDEVYEVILLSQILSWKNQPGSEFTLVLLTLGAAKPSYACSVRLKRCLENKRAETFALAQFKMLTVMTGFRRRPTV